MKTPSPVHSVSAQAVSKAALGQVAVVVQEETTDMQAEVDSTKPLNKNLELVGNKRTLTETSLTKSKSTLWQLAKSIQRRMATKLSMRREKTKLVSINVNQTPSPQISSHKSTEPPKNQEAPKALECVDPKSSEMFPTLDAAKIHDCLNQKLTETLKTSDAPKTPDSADPKSLEIFSSLTAAETPECVNLKFTEALKTFKSLQSPELVDSKVSETSDAFETPKVKVIEATEASVKIEQLPSDAHSMPKDELDISKILENETKSSSESRDVFAPASRDSEAGKRKASISMDIENESKSNEKEMPKVYSHA